MRIYIASSWKNQHAVELLTEQLRSEGHEILSFVENNHGEQKGHAAAEKDGTPIPFDEWVWSLEGLRSFTYDTNGATQSDLVIYIGPSGIDAWAEVGAAWGAGVPILALNAKGEQVGLMRRMATLWCNDWKQLMSAVRVRDEALSELRAERNVT